MGENSTKVKNSVPQGLIFDHISPVGYDAHRLLTRVRLIRYTTARIGHNGPRPREIVCGLRSLCGAKAAPLRKSATSARGPPSSGQRPARSVRRTEWVQRRWSSGTWWQGRAGPRRSCAEGGVAFALCEQATSRSSGRVNGRRRLFGAGVVARRLGRLLVKIGARGAPGFERQGGCF